ncbi:ATP-binding protein [Streptomyces sp. NPDC005907]|uniref:ATP-binding protein n=1 Tax=Streptomyces sp. NPDC005907 TaxID=3154571 RepID=UPI0033FAB1A8
MPAWTPDAAGALLAAGLLTLTVLLVRQRRVIAVQRAHHARLADRLRAWEEEIRHLVAVRLPGPDDGVRPPVPMAPVHPPTPGGGAYAPGAGPALAADEPAPAGRSAVTDRPLTFVDTGPLDARLAGTGLAACLDAVLERFAGAVERARADADRAARAALGEAMRSVGVLADEQQAAVAGMQDRYDDPDVLGDLLGVDHLNARIAHRVQALAVLCGSWPERGREACDLTDVVRGAASRIPEYRRIRVGGRADVTVAGRAVEPVVLALAELLDNATRHSPPGTTVEVDILSVPDGACVRVDDAGAGLDRETAEYATDLLSGRHPVDVTRLGDPPRFGFATVGALATRYGLAVSVDTRSPYGGVRAVVRIPPALLVSPAADSGAGADGSAAEGDAAQALPRRRRRTTPRVPGAGRVPTAGGPGAKEGTETGRGAVGAVGAEGVAAGGPGETAGGAEGGVPGRGGGSGERVPGHGGGPGERVPGREAARHDADTVRTAEENARRMSAFASGLRRGRAAGPSEAGARETTADVPRDDDGGTS